MSEYLRDVVKIVKTETFLNSPQKLKRCCLLHRNIGDVMPRFLYQ